MNAPSPQRRASAALPQDLMAQAVDAVIDQALLGSRLVGAVILIAHRGQEVYRRAAGYADREIQRAMSIDALFQLGSVSKPLVSAAVMVLVAQGRLNLDNPATRWLPEFRPKLADGRQPTITLRQLMTHTAGLDYEFFQPPHGSYVLGGVSDGRDENPISLRENIRRLASVPLLYEPGTAWKYSIATDVLAAVIEQVTQLPLPDAIGSLVTRPLGLIDTTFRAVDPQRLTAAYANDAAQPRRLGDIDLLPFPEGTAGFKISTGGALDAQAYPSGGAGMVGSAPDFLKFLEALRQGDRALLPMALVRQLSANQIGELPVDRWPGRGFGLGFTVLRNAWLAQTPESPGTWRMGGTEGHSWFVDPARQLSVVAFTNTALEGAPAPFVDALCRAVYSVDGVPARPS